MRLIQEDPLEGEACRTVMQKQGRLLPFKNKGQQTSLVVQQLTVQFPGFPGPGSILVRELESHTLQESSALQRGSRSVGPTKIHRDKQ